LAARERIVAAQARRTTQQMYMMLRAKGYPGSSGRVAAFAREWRHIEQERLRTARRGTFVPLVFTAGDL